MPAWTSRAVTNFGCYKLVCQASVTSANSAFEFLSRLLHHLIKCNPQMTDGQVKKMIADFTAMIDKCCKQTDAVTYLGEEVFHIFTNHLTAKADVANTRECI